MNLLLAESAGFSRDALARLRRLGTVDAANLDRAGLLARVRGCDALWVRLRHRIDAEVFDAAPTLRVIVTPTTGLNHVDVAEAGRRGIAVLSLKGESAFLHDVWATAEHTLALTLALLRHVGPAAAHVTRGGWNRDLFKGREIRGATLGIVGYGRVGRQVARCFSALGARVLVADPHVTCAGAAGEPPVTPLPLVALLPLADIVSLHVSLDAATEGFFDAAAFGRMKPGAIFINTARGELIDEAALLAHLESGRLAGAALDVLRDERATGMPGHPLVAWARTHPNLLITPHLGGCTVESMALTEQFMVTKLEVWCRS